MKRLSRLVGKLAFWAGWPLLVFYLRQRKRTRTLIVSEGCALVVKPWMSVGRWIAPGGGLHIGEASADGAVREIAEETGLIVLASQLKFVGEAQYRRYGLRFVYDQFVLEIPTQIEPKPGRPEIAEAAWMPLESLTTETAEIDVLALLGYWSGQP
jgi:ADP-ribose pyrophosphatase YjhB (NUDIX family)